MAQHAFVLARASCAAIITNTPHNSEWRLVGDADCLNAPSITASCQYTGEGGLTCGSAIAPDDPFWRQN
jgi:hypothetical protein